MKKVSLLLLSLLPCLFLVHAQPQAHTLVKIGYNSGLPPMELNEQQFAYFKLMIDESYSENADLIIKVVPADYDSDPDIYISKEN